MRYRGWLVDDAGHLNTIISFISSSTHPPTQASVSPTCQPPSKSPPVSSSIGPSPVKTSAATRRTGNGKALTHPSTHPPKPPNLPYKKKKEEKDEEECSPTHPPTHPPTPK